MDSFNQYLLSAHKGLILGLSTRHRDKGAQVLFSRASRVKRALTNMDAKHCGSAWYVPGLATSTLHT